MYAKLFRTYDPRYIVGEKDDCEEGAAQNLKKLQVCAWPYSPLTQG
jgi:hypothetical protein